MYILKGIITTALAILYSAATAQDSGVVFDQYQFNFGTVYEEEGSVYHIFMFRNDGNEAVSMAFANPSCKCITANFSKNKVMPGGTGEVEITFSPSGSMGETFRSVELVNSKNQLMGVLEITANVIPANRSIQERFYYSIADMVYASRMNIPFGYVYKGESITKSFYLANASSKNIEIKIETSNNQYLTVDYPHEIKPNDETPVNITYSAPSDNDFFATLVDTLYIYVNGNKTRMNATTKALFVKALDTTSLQPSMRTYPSAAECKEGKGEITIYNDGKADLEIYQVEIPPNVNTNLQAGILIKPNQSFIVKISLKNREKATLNIFTNDTLRPYKELIFN